MFPELLSLQKLSYRKFSQFIHINKQYFISLKRKLFPWDISDAVCVHVFSYLSSTMCNLVKDCVRIKVSGDSIFHESTWDPFYKWGSFFP